MSQLRDAAFNIKPPHPGPGSARLSRTPANAELPLPAAERASSKAACSAASQRQKQGPCELLGNALPRDLPHTPLQHLDQHSECWRSQACRDLWLHSIRSGNTPEMRCLYVSLSCIHCGGMTPRVVEFRKYSPFHTPCLAELPDLGSVLSSLSNQ